MYKIFLTLRYLTRKKIVIFPILVVWLCLMMIIIVSSIMGGFVDRVRTANRELLGDIVIYNHAASGFPYYEELQKDLQDKFPEIEVSTPVVHAYALLNLPRYSANAPAQVMGVDPVGRAKVSRFHENLFHQFQSPMNAVDDLSRAGLPKTTEELRKAAEAASIEAQNHYDDLNAKRFEVLTGVRKPVRFNLLWLIGLPFALALGIVLLVRARRERLVAPTVVAILFMLVACGFLITATFWPSIIPHDRELMEDAVQQSRLAADRAYRTWRFAVDLKPGVTWHSRADLTDALVPKAPSFAITPEAAAVFGGADKAPKNGAFIGVQIGLFPRDQRGNFDRTRSRDFEKALITVVPVSERGAISFRSSSTEQFVIVDDSYSGVYDVDSSYVYAPFEVVQDMALMRSPLPKNDKDWFPPRCNEILIKLKGTHNPDQLLAVRDKIEKEVDTFMPQQPNAVGIPELTVETWKQKQAKYLNAVENEKKMQVFILGLMSMVVLVVVFLIFYMIVRDKTRDIGIIKAVGGSEIGVMQIFLLYGLFIGVVGGGFGALSGIAFVTHTNQIHEWIYQTFGVMIWDRSVYLFDKIPDVVNYQEVAIYYLLGILSGVFGALIPAAFAGEQDPVKAVRYE